MGWWLSWRGIRLLTWWSDFLARLRPSHEDISTCFVNGNRFEWVGVVRQLKKSESTEDDPELSVNAPASSGSSDGPPSVLFDTRRDPADSPPSALAEEGHTASRRGAPVTTSSSTPPVASSALPRCKEEWLDKGGALLDSSPQPFGTSATATVSSSSAGTFTARSSLAGSPRSRALVSDSPWSAPRSALEVAARSINWSNWTDDYCPRAESMSLRPIAASREALRERFRLPSFSSGTERPILLDVGTAVLLRMKPATRRRTLQRQRLRGRVRSWQLKQRL